MQKPKNNEARPKFTGSYKKACMGKYKYKKHKSKSNTAKLTRQNATPSRVASKVVLAK